MVRVLLVIFGFCCSLQAIAEESKPAQRIVALAPHIVESLFKIGAGDRIVATVDYADHPAQALAIPRVGGYYGVQIEKIMALQPDLIIVWKNGNKAEDIAQLEKLGLPLAYSVTKNIEDVAAELRMFGRLTGLESNAERVANRFERSLVKIITAYQSKPPVGVFYQLWSEPLMTVNKNTWINQLIEVCGASNVFADNSTDYPQISMENVLVAKPEVIILPEEKADKPQPKIDWQRWQVIPAVKTNSFMTVDADLVHRFSSRMLMGLADMCQKIEGFR